MQTIQHRIISIIAVVSILTALLFYIAFHTGPLAPVSVTVTTVQSKTISPAVFGVGTVEARYTYKVSPSNTGKLKRLDVDVGDTVHNNQIIGELDVVDLNERLFGMQATLKRAQAFTQEAKIKKDYALQQVKRYQPLFDNNTISEDAWFNKQHVLQLSAATLNTAEADLKRIESDIAALQKQKDNMLLIAKANGLVVSRQAEVGNTLLAGQSAIEFIEPDALWLNVRFDQIHAHQLQANLTTKITLRSHGQQILKGHILRIEPKADTITEEALAKITFDETPSKIPLLGELAEVIVTLPKLPALPTIPNAAIQKHNNTIGVWQINVNHQAEFKPVEIGASSIDGEVQIKKGLQHGEQVIVYSEKALNPYQKLRIVSSIPEVLK